MLDAGADIHERDKNGNTLLHVVACFGLDAVGKVLVERGADPLAENAIRRLPAAGMALSANGMSEFAPQLGLNPVSVDQIVEGRTRLAEWLPSEPNSEGVLDRLALDCARAHSSERLQLRFGSWSFHLFETNIFHHLWFLWFLCWLVVLFAMLVGTGILSWSGRRWWLLAASCLPQAVMGASLTGSYGPDTSFGLLPKLHLFGYYACFYFFGCATFEVEGLNTTAGRRWKILLPLAAVLFLAGIATMNNRMLATVLQPAYAWTMALGLIGVFNHLCSKPLLARSNSAMSWLADASYWMYLVHVPLVMVVQWIVRQWSLPADVKFLIILAVVTPLLLISYRWCVRYTFLGRMLNGPRTVAKSGQ